METMWCCNALPEDSLLARDLQVTAVIPLERVRLFRAGREVTSRLEGWRARRKSDQFVLSMLMSFCRNDDNGLLVDEIRPEEITSVRLGEWTSTGEFGPWGEPAQRVELLPLEEAFFEGHPTPTRGSR